ncbi:hypothetical protein AB0L39_28645 [Streptomyces parvus]|uniref:hypothetical protein n=1 Tax=Streptomyces parvus TaxID=66428 RepID=UPI0034432E93
MAALDWIADAALRHENLNVLVARRPALDPVLLGSAVNLWLTDPERSKDLTDGLTLRTGERSVGGDLHPADAGPVIKDVRTGPRISRNLLIVVPR